MEEEKRDQVFKGSDRGLTRPSVGIGKREGDRLGPRKSPTKTLKPTEEPLPASFPRAPMDMTDAQSVGPVPIIVCKWGRLPERPGVYTRANERRGYDLLGCERSRARLEKLVQNEDG